MRTTPAANGSQPSICHGPTSKRPPQPERRIQRGTRPSEKPGTITANVSRRSQSSMSVRVRLPVLNSLEPEPGSRSGYDQIRCTLDAQSLRIHTEIVILVSPAVALPMKTNPLVALLVGVVDKTRRLFDSQALTLHRARDQRFARRVTEHMKSVLSLGQHFLGSTPDDHERAARDRFIDDVARHLDQLLVGRTLCFSDRRHPLL